MAASSSRVTHGGLAAALSGPCAMPSESAASSELAAPGRHGRLVGFGLALVRFPPAQRGSYLLEAGHRPGFIGAGFLGLVLWDDVAAYDVAGSPRLAVLVLGHSNHLSREWLKVCACLPGRVRGPAGVLRGSLVVPHDRVPVLDLGVLGNGVTADACLGDGLGGDGLGGDGLDGIRGARSVVSDGVTVVGAVTDRRDAVPGRLRRGLRAGRSGPRTARGSGSWLP